MEREQTFSSFLKEKRLKKGLGLREFARIVKMQPSNYCSIESGSLPPPKDKLDVIASALGMIKGSQEYRNFMDLAAKTKDEIPEDIARLIKSNSLVPAMLRTIEDQEIKLSHLKHLIEDIRSGRYKKKTSH